MAQKKEMDIPAADTLSCFQAAKANPTSPAQSPSSVTARKEGAVSSPVTGKFFSAEALSVPQMMLPANRCSGCQRKVGLTGFRCRCGELFCGKHRYSDRHDCSFDYKAAGRTAISRDNPLVRASKIVRI